MIEGIWKLGVDVEEDEDLILGKMKKWDEDIFVGGWNDVCSSG